MNSKLNILVLHQMGLPHFRRQAVVDLEYMLPNYAEEHNYIVHDCDLVLPDFIKDARFDAIILGPTFLCNRYNNTRYQKTLKEYDFIKHSNAVKIAMPQDDYDCSEILDKWMVDWKIDVVYAVIHDYWDILYPNYIKFGGILKKAYTGYISDELISKWQKPKEFEKREIDVSYRASRLAANFGEIGYIKSAIAERFIEATKGHKLKLDISINQKDMIPGSKWHDFLENSKFCLATNSGSSLLDLRGEFRQKVLVYTMKHPQASFEEIKNSCFPNEDYKYEMTAISPRNIEAILAETVQIAIPGKYSEIFIAYEHYIPIEKDCSNISDVIRMMKDTELVKTISRNAKERLLSIDALYYKNHVKYIINTMKEIALKKNIKSISAEEFLKLKIEYRQKVENKAKNEWKKKFFVYSLKEIGKEIGLKKVIFFDKNYK